MTRAEWGKTLQGTVLQVLVAAAIGLAVWYGVVNSELAVIRERIEALERDNGRSDKQYDELNARLAKMESRIDQIYLVLTAGRP